MRAFPKSVLATAVSLVIAGCSSNLYQESAEHVSSTRAEFNKEVSRGNASASYTTAPTKISSPIKIDRKASWLLLGVPEIQVGNAPISYVLDKMLGNNDIRVSWGYGVDPQMNVGGRIPATTLQRALDIISSRTGLAYEINEESREITWLSTLTKSFSISYVGGKYDYQIGSKSGTGGEGVDSEVGSFAQTENSYSSVSGEELDIYDEIKESVESILGESGGIAISRTSGTAIVTAPAPEMKKVEGFFEALEKTLNQQVMLNIRIIRFTSDDSNRRGIDWSALRAGSSNLLEFAGSVPAAGGLSSAPSIINYTKAGGNTDGSSLILDALDEQGDISIVTEPSIVAQINRVVELELGNITGYLAEAEVTQTLNSDISPSVDLKAAYVEEGYFLYATAKVTDKDNVVLHLASRFQDLLDITSKSVGLSTIETPSVSRNRFVQTVVLRNGSTLVVNSLKQVVNENGRLSPLSAQNLPSFENSNRQVVETLVLVTPVVMDMRS